MPHQHKSKRVAGAVPAGEKKEKIKDKGGKEGKGEKRKSKKKSKRKPIVLTSAEKKKNLRLLRDLLRSATARKKVATTIVSPHPSTFRPPESLCIATPTSSVVVLTSDVGIDSDNDGDSDSDAAESVAGSESECKLSVNPLLCSLSLLPPSIGIDGRTNTRVAETVPDANANALPPPPPRHRVRRSASTKVKTDAAMSIESSESKVEGKRKKTPRYYMPTAGDLAQELLKPLREIATNKDKYERLLRNPEEFRKDIKIMRKAFLAHEVAHTLCIDSGNGKERLGGFSDRLGTIGDKARQGAGGGQLRDLGQKALKDFNIKKTDFEFKPFGPEAFKSRLTEKKEFIRKAFRKASLPEGKFHEVRRMVRKFMYLHKAAYQLTHDKKHNKVAKKLENVSDKMGAINDDVMDGNHYGGGCPISTSNNRIVQKYLTCIFPHIDIS